MQRRIAHLDMDAFFASVELLRYPQLAGLPVVVGGRRGTLAGDRIEDFPRLRDYVGRGVATTATYAARALGVHSGMGLMKAAALAPDAILLPANFDDYIRYSRLFKAAVAEIAPLIEDRGIDEIYIELTDVPGETVELAQRIKDAVRAATGLSCSIGVTPNKLLSKIASDLDKPDGLTVLDHADVPTRIWPLAARKINGIGPRAGEKLDALGIHTVGELAAAAPETLIAEFGRHYGCWLTEVAHGRDERPVVTDRETKSISRETTFERDLDARADRDMLTDILVKLCERVAGDLKRKGYVGRTIGLKLRYDDFRTVTRDVTIERATDEAAAILAAVRGCLKRVPLDRRLRLLGVRVGTLALPGETGPRPPQRGENLRLFD
ncbi:DNA polymerase IV [Aromatoleum toluclasticum]|uniref:DNA polymerase IV n=1 Tax=Aromatoleum toluclasticum TaxID=92003 RepID=UPI001D18549B|nr:DNA polymerase IV [Aromatoleum toluclasticum]MCC4118606.1 DNA polymerase IV [Aromatoleum toluclasticum]